MTRKGPAFKNLDAVVGVGVVRSSDVDSEIKAHLVKTVVNGGGRQDADIAVFDTKCFAGGFEIRENPFGGFTGVTAEEDFDVGAGVVNETSDDFG